MINFKKIQNIRYEVWGMRCEVSYKLKIISSILILFFAIASVNAAYLKDIPTTVVQPNGDTLHCYASGDEFFNYLHDKNGFTIIQNDKGYYMYAIHDGDNIVPSQFVAGSVDPSAKGLQPYVLISNKEYQARRAAWFDFEDISRAKTPNRNHGTLNNLVVFIRFSDETDITTPFSTVDNMFNNQTPGFNSMINYFETTSYGQLTIPSTFYPEPNGDLILSYQDDNPRSYYMPYNATTNPNGYNGDNQRTQREHTLLCKAIEYIADMVPEDLDIDYNDDTYVDNVCFVIKGNTTDWATLLWPHRWALYTQAVYIHGKRVWDYNFMLEGAPGYFNTAVLSHEMQHTLSFPDFYHYGYSGSPCGNWDIMESNPNPPQQSGAYAKWKYGNWLNEPTEIQPGEEYTLNSVGNGTGIVSYKIPTDNPHQFFVLEYRDSNDPFENFNYGNVAGVLIYRIDTRWNGNAGYNHTNTFDEVFIFRPGGNYPANNGNLNRAHFGPSGRTKFDATTNPKPTLTDGTVVTNFSITITTNESKSFSFAHRVTQFYGVTFHRNGALMSTMDMQMFEIDIAQNLSKNTFRLPGRVFLGWALTPDGDVEYLDTQSIAIDKDIDLYAVWSPLGTSENKKTNTLFSIQPNPATRYFEITLSSSELSYDGITAQIYDVQGLLLKTISLTTEKTQIDISNFAKGFYIVKIGKEAKKLIVK